MIISPGIFGGNYMRLKNGDIVIVDGERCTYYNEDGNKIYNTYTKSNNQVVYYNFETKDCMDNIPESEVDHLINAGYVEIDASIFPCIKTLNDKGYKTNFCCGGHFCTLPLYFEDEVTSELIKEYKKKELMLVLNYISTDEIYISFDFNGMDLEKKAKAFSNIAAFVAKNDHLSLEKRVASFMYIDHDEDDNEITVTRNNDVMYKLRADFFDEVIQLKESELFMEYKDKMQRMSRKDIANTLREFVDPFRERFDTWNFSVTVYLDYMANMLEPLE